MHSDDPLMVGMFWAGLLVASVPMLLGIGIGIFVLRRYLQGRRTQPPAETVSDGPLPWRGGPPNR